MVVLVVTAAGLLIVGAGSAFAQQGDETTATENSSEFTCDETNEIVIAVGADGNITEEVPVGYVTYSDRVGQVERAIKEEYMNQPGVEDVYIERDPNKKVCGQNVSRVGVGLNFSVFEGSIPDQRNGVNIATHEAMGEAVLLGGGAAAANGTSGNAITGNDTAVVGENLTGGDAQIISVNETAEEGSDSGEGKAKSGDTTTEDSGGNEKAKTGEDGGNGKAKMGDGGDGDDAENGGNGKAKDGGGEDTDDGDGGGKDRVGDETDTETETAGEGPETDTATDTTTTTTDTATTTTTTMTTTTAQVEALTNGFSVVGVVAVLGILSVALLFRHEE